MFLPTAPARLSVPYRPEDQLNETQHAYVSWRVNPERDGTQDEWLKAHGCTKQDLSRWRHSPAFNAVYDKELRKHGVTHERIANMLDRLYQKGLAGDTQAMTKYLDWSKQMMPPAPVEPDAAELADDELAAALREAADRVQSRD